MCCQFFGLEMGCFGLFGCFAAANKVTMDNVFLVTRLQCKQTRGLFNESAASEQPMWQLSLSAPYDMQT